MGSAGEHLQAGAAGPVTAPAEGLAAALPPDGSPDFDGRRALVCSLGREGRDLASWLIGHGANVTMCDTRTDAQLAAASADAPPGVDRVVTGRPFPDPDGFDLIGVSQSVLATDAVVSRARALGIPVISPMQLFLRLCPAPIIGITGSSGKSTTTALVGEMARQQGVAHVVAGNIGGPVLGLLGRLRPETTVILELSHTQLQYTDRSPALAAVTNVGPNHLDQFDWDAYVALKQNLLRWQGTDAMAVMNADDPTSCELTRTARGKVMRCWLAGEVDGPGAWVEDETRRRTSRRPRRTHRGDLGDRSAWATQPRQRGDGDGDCLRRRVVSGCRRRRPPAVSGPQVGDVVLLSPAGTSFDAYANFESRGDAFRRAVQALPGFREAPMH